MVRNNYSINEMLVQNRAIYQIPDDRLYSVDDLLYNHQVFVNKYFKTKTKKDRISNLSISLAWFLAVVNRYHIDLEKEVWKRFPYKCPHCLDIPCVCSKVLEKNFKTGRPPKTRPENIENWQIMIKKIFPNDNLSFLEEKVEDLVEEINHQIRTFLREKKKSQFSTITVSLVDYFVTIIRLYNYYKISIEKKYGSMFDSGCYVCHKIPCECNYYK